MDSKTWLDVLQTFRAIGVIRVEPQRLAFPIAKALATGGMRLIEITWNSDRPAESIAQLRSALPECWIGAGTLLTRSQVREAIAAGAQFLFTPHVAPDLIHLALDQDVAIVAGALSPTEIVSAWQAGATCVKVFPVQAMGGAEYIRSLRAPLDTIPLIPTGGVTLTNARTFLEAGAIGIGLSGSLFPKQAIQTGDWGTITQNAMALMQSLAEA